MAGSTDTALQVELVAADRLVWSGQATMVIARTTEGDVGILPNHAPLLSSIIEGVVDVQTAEGQHLFRVQVYLDELDPELLQVELYADPNADAPMEGSTTRSDARRQTPAPEPASSAPTTVAVMPMPAGHVVTRTGAPASCSTACGRRLTARPSARARRARRR